jgi:hypothetical protein
MVAFFLRSLVNGIISLVELLISVRILLKLFGASTTAPFVRWVYETSAPLLEPFIGMFPSPNITGGLVLEFSAIFGLLVYAFMGYLLLEVINVLVPRTVVKE